MTVPPNKPPAAPPKPRLVKPMPSMPASTPLDIPKSLTELDQWVLWKHENDTKRPYSAHTRKPASSTRREDWVSYDEAVEVLRKYPERYSGLGFCFAADDRLTGVDLDDCLTDAGEIKSWARPIIAALPSYAEISPSGRGVKLFAFGKLPGPGVKRFVTTDGSLTDKIAESDGAIEMYDHGRYFTVTGHAMSGSIPEIEECQSEITALYGFLRKNKSHDFGSQRSKVEIPDRIPEGQRHNTLVSVAAMMRAKGLGSAEITAAILAMNQERCDPPKPTAEIHGIVDWVVQKPAGELRALSGGSAPVVTPAGSDTPPAIPDPSAYTLPTDESAAVPPNDIARLIMRDRRLLVHNDLLYEYNGKFWERITEATLASYALALDSHRHTKRARRSEAVAFVTDAARRREVEWRHLADTEIPVGNGVVDVDTCEVRPHRPEDYLEAIVPHAYTPRSHPHVWLSTLERWFAGDPDKDEKIDALQEFFGYCLLPHARFKRALFLYGESDTGKSQVPLILRLLVGSANTCTLNTDQMADERKRAPIVGKMLNVMTELPVDAMIADGGFKQLVSTGDPISIDPKYVDSYTYIPYCKHVICTNNLPEIRDRTNATYNRLLLIRFNNVIPKSEQDDLLFEKLSTEIQGVLAWAVEGAHRLIHNRGKFTEIQESKCAIEEYRESQNPMFMFLEEMCVLDQDERIPVREFREKFQTWYKRPVSATAVGKMAKSAGLRTSDKPEYDESSKRRMRFVFGVRLVF